MPILLDQPPDGRFFHADFDRAEVAKLRRRRGSDPREQKRSGERETMKREFLQNMKVGEQGLPKEIIDAILDENSRDIGEAKKPFADYEDLKARLEEAGKTIESFKGMDVEAVRKEADGWKAKAEQAERDAAAKVAAMQFTHALESAIARAGGRSAKAVTALLDLDALKASKNQEADIKAALEGLRQESGYLFEGAQTPPPYAAGTGTKQMMGETTKEKFAGMGYRQRLELKRTDPALYETLKG